MYPYIGYGYGLGYYGDDYFANDYYANNYDPGAYYAPQEQPQYQPYYGGGPDPNAGYPPVPYAMDPYQQPPANYAAPSDSEPAPTSPITLVTKNGETRVVQNYAIMNGFFWDFSKASSKRIPLGDVDVAASVKATEAAGGTFPEEAFGATAK